MQAWRFIIAKLRKRQIWERIFRERLAEPVHLNVISLFVALFGSFRAKVYFDLVVRHQHAFALLAAADEAKALGYKRFTAIECGVANGAGLLNICEIGKRVTAATGIEIDVVGFDNATGMPEAIDYRDHPEIYQPGEFVMWSREALMEAIPENARLIIGDVSNTIPAYMQTCSAGSPIAFVSIDVDYYSSTLACMPLFAGSPNIYIPSVWIYLDDVQFVSQSVWAGEMLAINEFNETSSLRKIGQTNFLREWRLFKRPGWISQIYTLHVFDHPSRLTSALSRQKTVLDNPYLNEPKISNRTLPAELRQ